MRWFFLVAAMLVPMAAHGAQGIESGKAVGVIPAASAHGTGGGGRTLRVGSDVAVGETVVTDQRGQVQLVFEDETRLVVGPGSSLLIEKYLLRGDQTASAFAINALSGSFRFITGKSPKAAYDIRTPTATIGVRGTAFDFTVDDLNLTTLVLFHGSVRLCTLSGRCTTLSAQCQVGAVDLLQSLQLRPRTSLRTLFPYVRSQSPLLVDFRVAQADRCLQPASTFPPNSLSGPDSGGASSRQAPTGGTTPPSTPPTSTPPTTPSTPPVTSVPPTTTPPTRGR